MKRAACLRYKETDPAPILVAKGEGYIAEKIIEVAKKHNIPIYFDPNLSSLLMRLELGEIPHPLYEAVARVLAFVLKLERNFNPKGNILPG